MNSVREGIDELRAAAAADVNALSTPEYLGLAPDRCLVNLEAAHLRRMGHEAEPWVNPATGGSLVALDQRRVLDEAGYTTWTPMGHLILCFAHALRTRITVRDDAVRA